MVVQQISIFLFATNTRCQFAFRHTRRHFYSKGVATFDFRTLLEFGTHYEHSLKSQKTYKLVLPRLQIINFEPPDPMVEMVCYFVTKQTLLKFTRPRAGSIKVTSESLVYQRVILKQN